MITGATSGIGRACAEKFAANGDHLILIGRRKSKLEEVRSAMEKQYGIKAFCLPFDVQQKEEVFEGIRSLPQEWTSIEVLVNSAGLALGREPFDEADMDDWETMINTNVKGLLYVSRAVIPFMKKKKSGHIINLGSTAGDMVYEKGNVYCASKSAVHALSEAMRIDLLPWHIKVTNVKPGAVETAFSIVRFKGDEEKAAGIYEGYTPLTGADVADTIFYCASLPPNVCINELTITCLAQANAVYLHKG